MLLRGCIVWGLILVCVCTANGQEEEALVEELQAAQVRLEVAAEGKAALTFVRPLVNVELSFIKRVCEPSVEQMKQIVWAATKAYLATGNLVQDENNNVRRFNNNNGVQLRGPNNELLSENPYGRVRRDALKYLKPILSQPQYETYVEEAKERDRFERATAIGLAIDMLDEKVGLTETQQSALTQTLMKDWQAIDLQWILNYVQNQQYLPPMPKDSLKKVLTPKQQKALDSFQQISISFGWGNQFGGEVKLDEEWIK